MLCRVHLVLKSPAHERLFAELLGENCITSAADTDTPFWDAVTQQSDLLLVERELIPEPVCESIATLNALPDHPEIVAVVESEDDERRAELLASGCYAVVSSTISEETLQATLQALVERRQTEIDNQVQLDVETDTGSRLSDFESESPVMMSFMQTVRRVVAADSSLLILGETGVGKERLARAIHEESPRGSKSFVPVNCAAFPESLLEGELFGHLQGAFTGATADRRGCFEMAHGGTIFLDEIGEIPRHIQVKLLRVLQEKQIQRLGSEELIPIDVRIMAATNRDLHVEMEEGRFRRDLFYRLSVVSLTVPPLREHPEDIPPLLTRYLDEFRTSLRKELSGYAPVAIDALSSYDWPGNVRELINVVERAALLCESDVISLADLPPEIGGLASTSSQSTVAAPTDNAGLPLPDDWEQLTWSQLRPIIISGLERRYLESHLRATKGRIGETAKRTGLSTRTLYLMMQRQGLKKESFKPSR